MYSNQTGAIAVSRRSTERVHSCQQARSQGGQLSTAVVKQSTASSKCLACLTPSPTVQATPAASSPLRVSAICTAMVAASSRWPASSSD